MVDSFTVLVRVARSWRARGLSSSAVVDAFVRTGLCSAEYAFLITRAVAVDGYMTALDAMFEQPVDYLSDPFPDLASADLAPEYHPDE